MLHVLICHSPARFYTTPEASGPLARISHHEIELCRKGVELEFFARGGLVEQQMEVVNTMGKPVGEAFYVAATHFALASGLPTTWRGLFQQRNGAVRCNCA
jgi:hypothetical protein